MIITIRDASRADFAACAAIYRHAVLHTPATWAYEAPSDEEFADKHEAAREKGFPFLVAVRPPSACDCGAEESIGGAAASTATESPNQSAAEVVVGYACAGTFRPREGYRFVTEHSIFLLPSCGKQGVGTRLMEALMARCAASGWKQMIAVISVDPEDADGSACASVRLHKRLGFAMNGRLPRIGWKFDRWWDCVLMQRELVADATFVEAGADSKAGVVAVGSVSTGTSDGVASPP
jgi:phosphinothricin acetyltransferase